MLVNEREVEAISKVIDLSKYGTLAKLLRVTAYVLRFVQNLKSKKLKEELKTGLLSVGELEAAEKAWIIDAQLSLLQSKDYCKLRVQLGVVSENEVLVCKGRLGNSDLDFRSKYPILLPTNHEFTELIIRDCHKRVQHNKLRSTLAEFRAKFWVPQGRQQIKKVKGKCQTCKRVEGKAYKQPPVSDLPDFRVTESLPFSSTGVDFAGPLFVKDGTGGMKKVYIALFTCCTTRAVHLELVENLTTSVFLNCLRRFFSRRGTPRLINSDNAKTLKAAAKLLAELSTNRTAMDYLETHRISWKFNLPLSPWWGGYFERMVGCVKRCLKKVLANSKLSQDELSTVLTEVESNLNCRPLTYLYDDLSEALTPSHLLYGHRLSTLSQNLDSDVDLDENNDKLGKRFLYLTKKISHFWNRWRKEYLTDLREHPKLRSKSIETIEKGSVVLLQDDNVKRGIWKSAVVEELIVEKDKVVRGATVRKYGRGKPERLTRPLQRLYPLEITAKDSMSTVARKECSQKDIEGGDREITEVREECGKRNRSTRAAAKDARWKAQLMLDP